MHAAGRGNSTFTPQQEKDSDGSRGEEEASRSLEDNIDVGDSGAGVGAGVEKEERKEDEKDNAKRSILDRLRAQRDARGVDPPLCDATEEAAFAAVQDGGALSDESGAGECEGAASGRRSLMAAGNGSGIILRHRVI